MARRRAETALSAPAVVATDISGVALERAAQHACDTDPAAAARIEWRQVDLLARPPERAVSAQLMQLPPQPRTQLFTALSAAAVRAGGILLVVGHHPSDVATSVPVRRCSNGSTPLTRSPVCSTA
jgi:hypothetical protein